jgi:uncharacterized membrane protein
MKNFTKPGWLFIVFTGMAIIVFLVDVNVNKRLTTFSGNKLVMANLVAGVVLIFLIAAGIRKSKPKE